MPFTKRFDEIVGKTSVPSEMKLWRNTFIIGIIVFVICLLYVYLQKNSFSLRIVNQSVAWASVILIGFSFLLSGVCYFWNFADRFIIYRKHLGLVGFWYAVIHVALTLYSLSQRFNIVQYFTASHSRFQVLVDGLIAFVIFALMALISNKYSAHELGGIWWRRILRLGYIAMFFAAVHFAVVGLPLWIKWSYFKEVTIPPLGIVVLGFIYLVIVIRVLLELDVRLKRKKTTSTPEVSLPQQPIV